jgi:hypothetical protein
MTSRRAFIGKVALGILAAPLAAKGGSTEAVVS